MQRCNFAIFSNITLTCKHDQLLWCGWCATMSEDGAARFREHKTVYEEHELVEKAIPSYTKCKKKWAVTIFGEWQISRSVIAPVFDPGVHFNDCNLFKVAQLSPSIEEIDAVTLNY